MFYTFAFGNRVGEMRNILERDMDIEQREYIERWFTAVGRDLCSAGWRSLRDLYVECVLYSNGLVRCSDREFGSVLREFGCEPKRVAEGLVYRVVES